MATIIDAMPAKGARKYPWDEWLDGKARCLHRGIDFQCTCQSMASIARITGRRRGVTVEASYNAERDVAYIQAILPPKGDQT